MAHVLLIREAIAFIFRETSGLLFPKWLYDQLMRRSRWINLKNPTHSKISVIDFILAVCEIKDVKLSGFGPMQLTAKRKPWKLMIEKIPWRKWK